MLDGSKLPDDPWLAWAILLIAFIGAVSPILVARMKDRAGKPDPPSTPQILSSPSQAMEVRHVEKPSLDASSQLLIKMVENLEERAKRAETKSDEQRQEMQKRIDDLEEQLFESRRMSDEQRQEIATLRFQVQQLTQQLIARGSGG